MIVWSLGEPKDQGYPLFAGDRFVGWITGWPQERDELMAALAERAERAAEVERLKAALVMYGAHTGGCGYEGGPKADPRTGYRCRCGLYDIIDGEAHLAALDQ